MILVTGGLGYIGSQFIKTYLSYFPNNQVVVVDNLSRGQIDALDAFRSQQWNFFVDENANNMIGKNIHFFAEDIGNILAMKAIFNRFPIEAVVHFAGYLSVAESQNNPHQYMMNNVSNSINLFAAMQETNVKRIVFSSSAAVYGNPKYSPIDEDHPLKPVSAYGLTKLLVEQILNSYGELSGWSCAHLRYFNAAGADAEGLIGEQHEPETHLIPLALQAAKDATKSLDIFGNDYQTFDGTCIRDYVHVSDLAYAHVLALKYLQNHQGSHAFNLGTGYGASVKEVINTCAKVSGKTIKTRTIPRRAGDAPYLVASFDKIRATLGWYPRYNLKQIIETAWLWESKRSQGTSAQESFAASAMSGQPTSII
jgi:UDP-glucose 4-epimerase